MAKEGGLRDQELPQHEHGPRVQAGGHREEAENAAALRGAQPAVNEHLQR